MSDVLKAPRLEPTDRIVVSDTAALAVTEWGSPAPDRPTIVLAHGWPDSSAMWWKVAEQLAGTGRFHVVAFDARGIGRSTPAVRRRPYALERMAADLDAVAHAVSPDRPVHLVGHDWGSVQGWEYVGDLERRPWAASFTTISGPCLDHLGHSLRARVRRPTAANVGPVLAQALKSAYVLVLHVPVLSTLPWRLGGARLFRSWLRRAEGVVGDERHPAPSLARDAIRGVRLYRSNVGRRLLRPRTRRAELPVLLVVATRDHYVSRRLHDDVGRWAPDLTRHDVDAGHWVTCTHPEVVAELVAEHVDAVEARAALAVAHLATVPSRSV